MDGLVAGIWSVTYSPSEAILAVVPSVDVAPAERTRLTDEAERLVRFIAPGARRHGVRWTSSGT